MIFGKKPYKFLLSAKQQEYKNILVDNIKTGKYKLVETKCLCGNIATKEVPDIDIIDNFFPFDTAKETGGIKVVICGSCSLARTTPYYAEENIADYYTNLYINIYTNNNMSPAELFDFLYNKKDSVTCGYYVYGFLKPFMETYKKDNNVNKVKVFEVGCGYAPVLAYFHENGEDVYGCDYGEVGIKTGISKGMKNLVVGGVDTLQQFGQADIVIVNHVLEHIIKPNNFLQELKSIMHENTLLFIGVPDIINSILIGKIDAYYFFQEAHIWHFTTARLNKLMLENSFKHIHSNSFIQGVYTLNNDGREDVTYNNADVEVSCKYLEYLNTIYFQNVDNKNQLWQKDAKINQLSTKIENLKSVNQHRNILEGKITFKYVRTLIIKWLKHLFKR